MKTGKYTYKNYKCTRCGNVEKQRSNHWGDIYPRCKECSWKNPMDPFSVWECLEPMPVGYEKPEPWVKVRLGDICKIQRGVLIK